MSKEVQEEFQRFRKEEVGHLFTFYATDNIVKAAEKWKTKSVSFKSPKSGRIFRTKKNSENKASKTEEKEKGKELFLRTKWSKLFNEFGKSKVSDFEYKQPKVRESSSYKPFWATKVVEAFRRPSNDLSATKNEKYAEMNTAFMKNDSSTVTLASYKRKTSVSFIENERSSQSILNNGIESLTISKRVETVEKGLSFAKIEPETPKFTLTNKGFTFVKDGVTSPALGKAQGVKVVKGVTSPALSKAKGAKVKASPMKRLSTVEHHHEHRLTLPPFYKGSEMYMPTGERLFWVRWSLFKTFDL